MVKQYEWEHLPINPIKMTDKFTDAKQSRKKKSDVYFLCVQLKYWNISTPVHYICITNYFINTDYF